MRQLKKYIYDTLSINVSPKPVGRERLRSLPMYLSERYRFFDLDLFKHHLLLAEPIEANELSILQTEKQFSLLKKTLADKVVLILPEITAFNRKRLIEKGINFIVPGKQLYLPDLLLDLREQFVHPKTKRKKESLLPSAQFLLIYHIIHPNNDWRLEDHPFKEIANHTGYSPMTITKAVDNLRYHKLIDVMGDKEKFIQFRMERNELWNDAMYRKLLASPVLKRVYVDEKPANMYLPYSNTSALPEYSDMNPGYPEFYAIEKSLFYGLQKTNVLTNINEDEGRYCLEVWKYDPVRLVEDMLNDTLVVDPLSLFLSLKESPDERIEMALDYIIKKYR